MCWSQSHAPIGAAMSVALVLATQAHGQWHTLHNDYQRSGYSSEVVVGPYERKWWRDFHDEMIATRCEAIVADDKVFVGTFAGTLYALDIVDGSTQWEFQADGPIGASPCYHDGHIYFGSDDGFDGGTIYCLRAANGDVIWRHTTAGGVWASPACDGSRVYVGDRSGVLHAVRTADGCSAWTFPTGYMILKPVSASLGWQKLVVGSEDMHVYCLTPQGELLWKSPKLPGLSLRDQAPTIWQGLAIVRTNPADPFHTVLGRNGETLEAIQRGIPSASQDKVLLDRWGDLLMAPRPERRQAEIEGVLEYLQRNRHDQSFFAFNLEDGSEPWIAPILFTSGLHNPPTPPTFNPQTGELFTLSRSALTHYVRGVRRYSCLTRINRQTGRPDWYWPESDEGNWRQMPMIPDETQALGLMGDLVVSTHQGELGALDPKTGTVTTISPTRDTYAGIFGPGAVEGTFEGARRLAQRGYLTGMPNEWHGPDRAIVSIAKGRIFWIAGSQVVCIAGPDVPKTATGGTRPPAPFRSRLPNVAPGGNVANVGQDKVDTTLTRRSIRSDELREFLDVIASSNAASTDELSVALRSRLDDEILELINGHDGAPWAPLIVQLGISGQERHFFRTERTIQILSHALPHLSPKVRAKTLEHLDQLVRSGCPLSSPSHSASGARREPFDLGPTMREFARREPQPESDIADLYALWAYAHFGDRWQKVLTQKEQIANVFDRFVDDVPHFDPHDMKRNASQLLNRQIAGLLGAVRIFRRLDDDTRHERSLELLASLVSERSTPRTIGPPSRASRGRREWWHPSS